MATTNKTVHPRWNKLQQGPQTGGIVDDLLSTGRSVAKTVSGIAEGNPLGLLEIPNTVMQVVDTTRNIINNVSKSTATEKVIVPNHTDLKTTENTIVLNKLKENMPVITTTQVPSSYATEYSNPPLNVTEKVVNGRKVTNVDGAFALTPFLSHNTIAEKWSYAFRLTPLDPNVFGDRVSSIAKTFQMYSIDSVTAHVIPIKGTDFIGNYYLNFMEGTDIVNQYKDGVVLYQDVSQREFAQPGTIKQGASLTYRGKGDWLYVNDAGNTSEPGVKFFSSATFGTLAFNYSAPVGPERLGFVVLKFNINFMSAAEFPYNFLNHMKSSMFTIWLTHCGLPLSFDKWLCLVWNLVREVKKDLLEESQVLGTTPRVSMIESFSLDRKTEILHQRIEESKKKEIPIVLNTKKTTRKFALTPDVAVLGMKIDEEFDISRYQYLVKDLGDNLISDYINSSGFQRLLLVLTLYFRGFNDMLTLNESSLLSLVERLALQLWKSYNPVPKKYLQDPTSDEEDEEDYEQVGSV